MNRSPSKMTTTVTNLVLAAITLTLLGACGTVTDGPTLELSGSRPSLLFFYTDN